MTIPKSYEALAADLASEKIISKTLQGQKEAYMMIADSRKIELNDALARESELKSGLKTTLNDLHGRDDAVYDLRIDLKAAQDRESALREELSKLADDYCEKVDDLVSLQRRLTVEEQRAVKFEGLLLRTNELLYQIQGDPGAVPSSAIDAMRGEVFTALKPDAEGEGS